MANEDWIVGVSGADGRPSLAHAAEPWFSCVYAERAEAAGEFFGLTVEMDDWFFCNFVWRDGIPHESTLAALCSEAAALLARRRPPE